MEPESTQQPKKQDNRPILFRLTRRVDLFLTLLLASLLLFYIIGNQQRFLDSDIRLILILTVCTSSALFLFLTASITECIYYSITQKKSTYIAALVTCIILLIAAATVAIGGICIITLSAGLLPQA